jgi:hypothetical protein
VKRLAETQMLSIHRLVQAVLVDSMDEQIQRQWAERTVQMVNDLFPTIDGVERQLAQRYIAHAQVCAKLIDQWSIEHVEAARLLHEAGSYFFMMAQYKQAEPLLKRGLEIREHVLGSEHCITSWEILPSSPIFKRFIHKHQFNLKEDASMPPADSWKRENTDSSRSQRYDIP